MKDLLWYYFCWWKIFKDSKRGYNKMVSNFKIWYHLFYWKFHSKSVTWLFNTIKKENGWYPILRYGIISLMMDFHRDFQKYNANFLLSMKNFYREKDSKSVTLTFKYDWKRKWIFDFKVSHCPFVLLVKDFYRDSKSVTSNTF